MILLTLGSVCALAESALVIDLRPQNGSSRNLLMVPGHAFEFDVYAILSGTNGIDDESLTSVFVKLISTRDKGAISGSFSPAQLIPAFQGLGSTSGSPTDTDADGQFDALGDTTNASYMFARSPVPNIQGTRVGMDSEEFLLGTVRFTFGPDISNGFIDILPVKPSTGISPPAVFQQDGIGSTAALYSPTGHLGVYGPLIPEPGLGLVIVCVYFVTIHRKRTRVPEV